MTKDFHASWKQTQAMANCNSHTPNHACIALLSYVSPVTGEEIKEFRKGWTGDKLQVIINEFGQNPNADVNADFENASDIDAIDDIMEEAE